jgi:calcineurin-like phosphoesterase family protein
MSNTFLISDTHWGHAAAVRHFKRKDGSPLRDFESAEACDEYMIEQWNRVVGKNDKVYHLGDVVMPKNHLRLDEIMPRLNGDKVLIKGNHDELKPARYLAHFRDIRGSHLLDNLVLTHVPLHPASLLRWRGNIHGHLHSYAVQKANHFQAGQIMYHDQVEDPKYFCVSVERINYTPIPFETVNKIFKDRGF